jgi:hypothetical protein
MLGIRVTYAQYLGAANQHAPAPDAEPLILNDRTLNAAMLHELVTGMKRRCSEEGALAARGEVKAIAPGLSTPFP